MDYTDKAVIVVGGFGGIGMETCRTLLSKGINSLGIFDVNEDSDKLEALVRCDENALIKMWKVDITNKTECMAAFHSAVQQFGFIDLVIHSVGIVDELTPEHAISVNLVGTINVNLAAIHYMNKETDCGRGGTIATIASVNGLEPCPSYPVYAASKHGIVGFLRSLGTQELYERTGIKIIVVCPGFTRPSMPKSVPDAIFPHLPLGSPYDKFQSTKGCAECLIEAVEANEHGSIWIIDNLELTAVTPIKYFFPPPAPQ